MGNERRASVVLLVAALTAAGCTPDPKAEDTRPSSITVPCPDDVQALVVPTHTCGRVDIAGGSPHSVFYVSVEPPAGPERSPILETGTDLGMTPGYGGLAPIARRTGRRVVIVDLPGTGHSTPSMDCPELEELSDTETTSASAEVARAVTACRKRLVGQGVDPTRLSPAALADDLYAVMNALGAGRWVVMGHGTTSAAGVRLAADHPERVEALVVDSMVQDGVDARRAADRVVAAVARTCAASPDCTRRYGDVTETWRRARTRLATRPMEVDVAGEVVRIDAAHLDRAVRWLVAPVAMGARLLPALLAEVDSGTPGTQLSTFAATLHSGPPLCVGYLPKCETGWHVSAGATLSALCPVLGSSPEWTAACSAWGPAAPERDVSLRGVPALALVGSLDPFAAPDVVRARLTATIPEAFVVIYPTGGHNVLGGECMRSVRNAWLAGSVDRPPTLPACLTAPLEFD